MRPSQHRETARVLVIDDSGKILLFLTHFDPEVGLPPRWITPGGGIDGNETPVEAAVRELHEETGLKIEPESLGEAIWQTSGRWDWADGVNHHTFADTFFELRVTNFEIDQTHWTDDERRDVVDIRWWNLTDLTETAESVGPPGLAEFLKRHLS